MTLNSDGWWFAEISSATPGCDYGFILDGQGPFPDPRSPWQPYGVHGLSRLVDHETFPWTDEEFKALPLASAVIYEMHIGTFTPSGNFTSAIEKLDHLVDLGITHVQLMPVNEFSGDHGWGYDGVQLFAPYHTYGGPEALKKLVNACHQRKLAVLLDVVYNHLGPSGNYLGCYAPYFNQRYSTPWGEAVNFDGADSEEVRRFFCDNALMWLRDFHFDGLRLDAVHAILDTSAQPFLEQLAVEVKALAKQLNRPLVVIPESDLNDPRLLWPKDRGGFDLDAQWSDDFHHALHAVLTEERKGYYEDFGSFADLAKSLQNGYVYDGRYSKYRRRRHGRPPTGLPAHKFLGYLQNHDQVGNRAQGDRISQLVSSGRMKIGAAIVLTSPFVPMLFQGEEWAATTPFQYFSNHPEPELAKAVREGRRNEFVSFGWNPTDIPDPQNPKTYENSKLHWAESSESPHKEMLDWYRRLIQLRHQEPSLRNSQFNQVIIRFDEESKWFVMERESIWIAFNLGTSSRQIELEGHNHRLLLSSEPSIQLNENMLELPVDSIALVRSQ